MLLRAAARGGSSHRSLWFRWNRRFVATTAEAPVRSKRSMKYGVNFEWDDFVAYRSSGTPLEGDALELLTVSLAEKGHSRRLRAVMSYLTSTGESLDRFMFRNMFRALNTSRDVRGLRDLYKEMQECLVEPEPVMFDYMIASYGWLRDQEGIEWALEQMEKASLQWTAGTYASLIKAYDRCYQEDTAKKLYKQFLDSGMDLDREVCHTIMQLYARKGNLEEVKNVIALMKAQNLPVRCKTRNLLILAYLRRGMYKDAERVLKELEEESGEDGPNGESYDILIYQYAMDMKIREALAIYQRSVERGIESPHIHRRMLLAYARGGMPAEAEGTFYTLARMNSREPAKLYELVIEAHTRAGSPDGAENWIRMMEQKDMQPSTSILREAAICFLKVNNVAKGLEIVNALQRQGGEVGEELTLMLVEKLSKQGDLAGAEATLNELLALRKHRVPEAPVVAMIKALVRADNFPLAERILDRLRTTPRGVVYTLAKGYAQKGDMEGAKKCLKRRQGDRKKFSSKGYAILIDALTAAAGPTAESRGLKLLEEALSDDGKPTLSLAHSITELMKAVQSQYGMQHALALLTPKASAEVLEPLKNSLYRLLDKDSNDNPPEAPQAVGNDRKRMRTSSQKSPPKHMRRSAKVRGSPKDSLTVGELKDGLGADTFQTRSPTQKHPNAQGQSGRRPHAEKPRTGFQARMELASRLISALNSAPPPQVQGNQKEWKTYMESHRRPTSETSEGN